ncbi:MAG TPA: hypothetical protein VF945_10860, partial [Polyangia bacterium]
LGLKTPDDVGGSSWGTEDSKARFFEAGSSRPRPFETGAVPVRRSSLPSIPVQRTGTTGALPLSADEDKIRVNTSQVASRDGLGEPPTTDNKRSGQRRTGGGWGKRLALFGVLAVAGGGGAAAYHYKLFEQPPAVDTKPKVSDEAKPDKQPAKQPDKAKATKAVKQPRDDDKMSPAEIDRMLEWARRTAEGGRILAPPGDNLKELLDRIDKADPGNAQAEALKQKTTSMLGRKGTLALKKGRLDEAADDFDALVGLKPDDDWSKGRLARALTLRAQRSLGKNKLQAALADATAALEFAPEDTNIQLTLGDTHLAMGKRELAAEEYQRVLDVKPADIRAKLGLARATAPKVKPGIKKRKGR